MIQFIYPELFQRWWKPEAIEPAVADKVDKAVLNNIYLHVVRVPFAVLLAAALIAAMAAQSVPLIWPAMWFVSVLLYQVFRTWWVRRISAVDDDKTAERLNTCVQLFFWGSCLFALSVTFVPFANDTYRFVLTIIMIALVVGGIATLHGYPPLHFSIAVPNIGAVTLGWLVSSPNDGNYWVHYALAGLLLLLLVYMFGFSRYTYRSVAAMQVMNSDLQEALESAQAAHAAKTHFFQAASHDLRQPLQSITIMSHNLSNRNLSAENTKIVDSIGKSVAALSQELDMLLEIAELDSDTLTLNKTVVDVAALLEDIIDLFKPIASSKGVVVTGRFDARPTIETDTVLLNRLFRNLVDNAVKYTDKGSVTIFLHIVDAKVVVEIEDTGVGIDSKDLGLIFNEFYQTDNPERDRRKGLGLGLSAVQRIVPLLDAVMSVDSTLHKGSCFRLEFTGACDRNERRSIDFATAPHERSLSDRPILLIQDDPVLRDATRTLLESWNMDVSVATDWHSTSLSIRFEPPDVVLCDLQLINESGYEIANGLKISQPHLPLILFSEENSLERESVKIGDTKVLSKPVDVGVLAAEIVSAINTSG